MDGIIVFHRLDERQITAIVDIQLKALEKRLSQQHLSLELDHSARQLLSREGYDPQFGARPLKRAIQELLLDPLATKILDGEFLPGNHLKVKSPIPITWSFPSDLGVFGASPSLECSSCSGKKRPGLRLLFQELSRIFFNRKGRVFL